jgi:5-methyltetrahydropteroyltriglutamate--homocysteine methyltransferase
LLRSEGRILTTHAGSLPRPAELNALLARRSRGEAVDATALERAADAATRDAVGKQIACGIDVGNDGEQPRESFFTHLRERLSGFGGRASARSCATSSRTRASSRSARPTSRATW